MRYLAEFYLPDRHADLARLAKRVRAAAQDAGNADTVVRFVSAIHAPDDESCFVIYEADSPASVKTAGSMAGITFDRIVEVFTDDAGDAAR